jgi:hypothetical protein
MKHAKLAIAVMVAASLVVPTVHAKKKNSAPSQTSVPSQSLAASQPGAGSQAGGLPATNARVTALEQAVVVLRNDLAAEIAARQAADTRLANALNDEIAARQAADAALASQLGTIPQVFVAEGAVSIITGATATVASKTVPAGTYFMLAAVQMVNSQAAGDANARCVMSADGNLLADTSDLQFPILTTADGATSNAFGSTMFAPLQGSYTSTSPITVSVECTESNGDNGGLTAFAHIAALKAGSVQ